MFAPSVDTVEGSQRHEKPRDDMMSPLASSEVAGKVAESLAGGK